MKKIIFIIFISFIFIPNISSSSWTSEIPKNKPIIIYEEETKYKWYKLNKINERVISAFEHNCEYFDEIENSYSDWTEKIPNTKDNRIIEEKEIIINDEYEFIIMEKFLSESLTIKELDIINKDKEKIPYTLIQCSNCNAEYNNYKNLNDNNLNTTITINNNSLLLLKLNNKYIENFRIELYYEKENIVFGWTTRLTLNVNNTIKKMDFNKSNLYSVYSSSWKSLVIPSNTNWIYNDSNIKKLYRFKDNLVNCYDYEKEYLNGYFTNVDNYIKDETTKTIYYKYDEIIQIKNMNSKEKVDKVKEISDLINDESQKALAINYGSKKVSKDYYLIPIFIIALGGILVLLVLICRKMKLNIKESR